MHTPGKGTQMVSPARPYPRLRTRLHDDFVWAWQSVGAEERRSRRSVRSVRSVRKLAPYSLPGMDERLSRCRWLALPAGGAR